jgi:hypothetical protein
MSNILTAWMREIVGKELLSVQASLFALSGVVDYQNPQQLKLDFGILPGGYITCSPDGFSVVLVHKPLEAFDMGDAGERIIQDISNQEIFAKAVGSRVRKAIVFNQSRQSKPVGVGFYFEHCEVHVVNLGDELYVYSEYPEGSFGDDDISPEIFG